MTATLPAFVTSSGKPSSWNRRPWACASGRNRWCRCACPCCSIFARTPSNAPSTRPVTTSMVRRARIRASSRAKNRGTAPGELSTVSTAPAAGILLDRTSHAEVEEPAVKQLAAAKDHQGDTWSSLAPVARARPRTWRGPRATSPGQSSLGLGKILKRLNGYRDDVGLPPGRRHP